MRTWLACLEQARRFWVSGLAVEHRLTYTAKPCHQIHPATYIKANGPPHAMPCLLQAQIEQFTAVVQQQLTLEIAVYQMQ